MNIAVIGSTHAGTAAVKNMARLYPDATIHVYERNDNVSFLSCGLALYVGGVVQDAEELFYSSPEELSAMGIHVHMQHNVLSVDDEGKTLRVKDLLTGEERTDRFDKLVMTTGSWPVIPPIEGIEQDRILLAKNYNQANTIINRTEHAQHITVIGAGYIGVELVEAFEQAGKSVTLVDGESRILSRYFDSAITNEVERALTERGIELRLNETVEAFRGDGRVRQVVTNKGTVDTDLVILCIGFRPNTGLLSGKVDMLANGAIKVNEYMQTSHPDIFAAGDCCAISYNPTGEDAYIPLATNAVRTGTLVAHNLLAPRIPHPGTQGTSGLHLFGLNLASTGLTDTAATQAGLTLQEVTVQETNRPTFMPDAEEVRFTLRFDPVTRIIKGAQVLSQADVTQAINTMSVVIQKEMTVEELAFVDFFFQPHFNHPWHFLNKAGLAAMDALKPTEAVQAAR